MNKTLLTVTAGVVALSTLVAVNSFASTDASSSLSQAADRITNMATRTFEHGSERGPRLGQDVTVTNVVAVDGGFSADITSTDTGTVARIREQAADQSLQDKLLAKAGTGANAQISEIDGGVKVTITSTDAGTAAKLAELSTKLADNGGKFFPGFGKGDHKPLDTDFTRTVTVLENGFVLDIAAKDTADTEAIAKIQEREAKAPKGPEDDSVTRTVENTAAGAKVTVTSSDADTAAKLVEMGTAMRDGKMPDRPGHHGGMKGGMKFDHDATRTVTVLANGFSMDIAAKDTADTEAIAKIQEREAKAPKGPEDDSVTRTVENTAAGAKVTVTSSDADTAAKLVEMGTAMRDGKMPEMGDTSERDQRGGKGFGGRHGRMGADDANDSSEGQSDAQ